ncbi:hypothetical protein G647_01029 [Cladophialophora carrionii CBS 160.54]|uniref:Uncharacterized protein n=1 Tax=Cladophialophora carrionii CBS 160.54 TaxID=1279043 RepID=V9DNV2_9EURO|nr:uncharacterized protein G647_01029 [Cladophialophora carrionii CBS 160.54]ETI28579.1 hypothetical protein G647_01029 [Cladophialophora carrionii CBS 160.54]
MPPRRSRNGNHARTTAFGRKYPNLQRALLLSCEASPFLLLATIAAGAGIWKRPMWQRAILWRLALWSFLSRWLLVGFAITTSWNDWGREDREERDEGHRNQVRQELQEQLERNQNHDRIWREAQQQLERQQERLRQLQDMEQRRIRIQDQLLNHMQDEPQEDAEHWED